MGILTVNTAPGHRDGQPVTYLYTQYDAGPRLRPPAAPDAEPCWLLWSGDVPHGGSLDACREIAPPDDKPDAEGDERS